MWAFPSLASSLLGLGFMACEVLFKSRRSLGLGWRILLILILLAIVVGIAVTLLIWRFDNEYGLWWMPALLYFISFVPWSLWHPWLVMLALALTTYIRVGGVADAALHHYGGGQPYCLFHGSGFGAVYIMMGVIAALFSLPTQLQSAR